MPDISIGRYKGGFCVYWWEDGKRRRFGLKARTRADAEPEALDIYRRETYRPDSLNVAQIWEAYREDLGERPTAKTMLYTGKSVLAHFGAYRPDQISKAICVAYFEDRQRAGISQGSVWTELGHLRSALRWAAEKARITPMAPHIWRPAKPKPRERYLTEAEIQTLLAAAETPHIKLAILLMLSTAARVGAVLDLTWDRVDFDRRVINYQLEDSVTRKGRAQSRINDGLLAALSVAKAAALSPYVVEYAGDQVKSIRKGMTTAFTNAGLEGVTIHTLRHTAAVHLVSAGVSMEKVSQMLGHSNTQITYSTYARFQPDHMAEEAEILDFTKVRRAV